MSRRAGIITAFAITLLVSAVLLSIAGGWSFGSASSNGNQGQTSEPTPVQPTPFAPNGPFADNPGEGTGSPGGCQIVVEDGREFLVCPDQNGFGEGEHRSGEHNGDGGQGEGEHEREGDD